MSNRTFHKWTSSELLYLINNFDAFTRAQLAQHIGVSENSVKRKAYDLRLKKSPEALKKLHKRPNSGQFSKGSIPANVKYDDAISIRNHNGWLCKWIRVSMGKWVPLHRYIWLEAGNALPEGCIVAFKDEDSMNCDISNLYLITKADNLMRNMPKGDDRKALQEKILASRKDNKQKRIIQIQAKRRLKKKKLTGDQKRRALRTKEFTDKRQAERLMARQAAEAVRNQARQEKVVKIRAEKEIQKAAAAQERKLQHTAKSKARAIHEHKQKQKEAEQRKVLKTRVINTAELIPLRIDSKTVVYIKPGQDPEKILEKYKKREVPDKYAGLPPSYQF